MILSYGIYVICNSNLVWDNPKQLEVAFRVDLKIRAWRKFVTWPTWEHSNQKELKKQLEMIRETISCMKNKIKLRSQGFINFDV